MRNRWFDVFGFWLLVTRDYHLTLAVATLATALLVAPYASAVVYIEGCFCGPGSQGFGCGGGNLLYLLATVNVLTEYVDVADPGRLRCAVGAGSGAARPLD